MSMNTAGNAYNSYGTEGIKLWQFMLLLLIGAAGVFIPAVVTSVWLYVCAATLYGFFKGRNAYIWYAIAASPALEIWSRMTGAPLMPYESGKYFLFVCILLLAILQWRDKQLAPQYRIGGIILFALFPSLIVGIAAFDWEQWVFNVLAVLELGLLLILVARERLHVEQFCRALQYSLMAIMALTIYISVKSPVFSDIDFSLKANSSASGGFGSNQVSSIMGAGMVLTVVLLLLKRPLFAIRWFNYLLLGVFIFRGLLTFSRGGMVVAVLALIVAVAPKIFASVGSFIRYSLLGLLFGLMGLAIFYKVNDATGNMLLLRYEGETPGTYAGSKTKTFNTMISGRGDVVMSDLAIFSDHWLFGVGPGEAKLLRRNYGYDMDVAAHTEYTRLLSEHGLGGLFVVVMLFAFPVYWLSRQKNGTWRGISGALFTLALLTAVHSASRTNITVVYFAFAAMPVLYETTKKYYNKPVAEDSIYRQ